MNACTNAIIMNEPCSPFVANLNRFRAPRATGDLGRSSVKIPQRVIYMYTQIYIIYVNVIDYKVSTSSEVLWECVACCNAQYIRVEWCICLRSCVT